MSKVNEIQLTLSPAAFAAIHTLVSSVRLGGRNEWEDALLDTQLRWDKQGLQSLLNRLDEQVGFPEIRVEASESDGIVLNLE